MNVVRASTAQQTEATRVGTYSARSWAVAATFFGVAASIVVASAYTKPHFAIAAFLGWLGFEAFLRRRQGNRKLKGGPAQLIPSLLVLFRRSDPDAERLLAEKIEKLLIPSAIDPEQAKALQRIKDLVELRGLAFGKLPEGKKILRGAMAFRRESDEAVVSGHVVPESLHLEDLANAAMHVTNLYWRLLESCERGNEEMQRFARQLFWDIFGVQFDPIRARRIIEALADAMMHERGLPFVLLNLVHRGQVSLARRIAQVALLNDFPVNEDDRSASYWIAELAWFAEQDGPMRDSESVLRHLYHLCFTNPDRGGFLEIDGGLSAQFEGVNEIAEEGFLFREDLFDRVLQLWQPFEGFFDGVLSATLETLSQNSSKILNERETWLRFWSREREHFGREYLYVVEGNLSYAAGHWADAKGSYEKALECNPTLRSALLNIPFCDARLKDKKAHDRSVERLLARRELYPAALYASADSYLLAGNTVKGEALYKRLAQMDSSWQGKIDSSISSFLYDNGLFEQALPYAKKAHENDPHNGAAAFQLSLCLSAVGDKKGALRLVEKITGRDTAEAEAVEHDHWLQFHRFTLERDSGNHEAASRTLLEIPREYFEDPEELEAAQRFARDRRDFALLHHLRNR